MIIINYLVLNNYFNDYKIVTVKLCFYKLRINAEKDLVEIKKKYPTAFLIKPNR